MPASRSLTLRRLLPVLLAALWLLPAALHAQVLDDSTKVLYGAKTTRILREADILREQYEGRLIDTTLTNQMQARHWFHDTTFQQDLGNVGTASRRLLWEPNTELGARFGRNAFDKYVRNSATIPYYDTRSPYTFFRFIQSGFGEQVFELSYTRSIGKNANIGMAYERFASNKILQANGREGLAEHSNVLLFGRFQGKNDRYHGLFNINTARHRSVEQGGIRYQASDTLRENVFRPRSLFEYELERVNLTRALNVEDRDEVRLVQTYRLLGKGLTAYHIMDWKRQFNKYSDEQLITDPLTRTLQFYPRTRFSPSITNDRAEYRQFENTLGIMGHSSAVEYRLYGRYRDGRLKTQRSYQEPQNTVLSTLPTPAPQYNQLFVGGTAGFRYRNFIAIETAGEVLAVQLEPQGKGLSEYWFRGAARLGPLSAEFLSTSYSPTLTQQRFTGNHYAWDHTTEATDFRNTLMNQITGRLAQRLGQHHLEASVSAVTINDLVYYKQDSLVVNEDGALVKNRIGGVPTQLSEAKVLLIGSLRHRFNVGHFFFDNQATATSGGDGNGLRIPGLVANGKVYYQNYLFKKALFGQIGAEVYYQSRFRGYDYSPSTQQFYLQDNFTIRNYSVADVFLVTDIKTVSVFLKVAYVNQGLYEFGNGYFATPYYTGLPRRFQLGIKWQFFD